jgi:two-component system cell cycle response regulator
LFKKFLVLQQRQTLKFRVRLWVGAVILMLALAFILSFYMIEKNDRSSAVQSQLQQVISLQSLYIESWTNERTSDIKRMANSLNAKQLNFEKLRQDFRTNAQLNSDYESIFFVDSDGYTSAASATEKRIFVGDRGYFQAAKNKTDYMTGVIISKISGNPIIMFSSPVTNDQNEFIGLIAGAVQVKTMDRLMESLNFGHTGELFVIDRNGSIITQSKNQNSNKAQSQMKTEIVQRAIAETKEVTPYMGYHNKKVYGSYQWSKQDQWIVVGEITEKEVFSNLYRIIYTLIIITLAALLLSFAAVFLLTSWIERPINNLLKGTKTVKDGNFDYQIAMEEMKYAPIELQQLCDTYNVMSRRLKTTIQLLEHSALLDQLTEIHNRRYIMTEGSGLMETCLQTGNPCSVIMADVDLFKQINDTHGHLIGDKVLKHVANLLSGQNDKSVIAARYGGEEFIILVLNADAGKAAALAESLRKRIMSEPYSDGTYTVTATVSMGVAEYSATQNYGITFLEDMISRADAALYQAKHSGRNRIIVDGGFVNQSAK